MILILRHWKQQVNQIQAEKELTREESDVLFSYFFGHSTSQHHTPTKEQQLSSWLKRANKYIHTIFCFTCCKIMYNPYDYYFKKAKTSWYVARSAFKLDEIDKKFQLLNKKTLTVLDIWCSPWSWLQYAASQLSNGWHQDKKKIIWMDLKPTKLDHPLITTYVQDITEREKVSAIFAENEVTLFDVIISDMAPNTMWDQATDALMSSELILESRWIYQQHLAPHWRFAIKIFMWPWFDDFLQLCRKTYGGKNIKVFKPKACRKGSKETYIVKV